MNVRKKKITPIVWMHYVKLILRSALFAAALVVYIVNRVNKTGLTFGGFEKNSIMLMIIVGFFVIEMIMRLIPHKFESMGCQKQFEKNYKPKKYDGKPEIQPPLATFCVFVSWIALNAIIGILYFARIIDGGIVILISLAFSICGIICILFFCPFQTWMMKNICCGTCRIYNWDYAMMFTPLIFIPNYFTWTLLGMALIIVIKWELTVWLYPERFSEKCNNSLSCAMCKEKLCQHKTQLQSFLKKRSIKFNLRGNILYRFNREKHGANTVAPSENSEKTDTSTDKVNISADIINTLADKTE